MDLNKLLEIAPGIIEIGLIPFDLYLQDRQGLPRMFREARSDIHLEHREQLLSGKSSFLVRGQDHGKYLEYVFDRLEHLVTTQHLKLDDKTRLFHAVGNGIHKSVLEDPLNALPIRRCGRFVKNYIDLMLHSKNAVVSLLSISAEQPYKYSHGFNVCTYCMLIGRTMFGNSRLNLWQLGMGGLLYDIGMTKVNPEIIAKKGSLTHVEKVKVKRHPQESFLILSKQKLPYSVQMMGLYHHEHYDGSGYPKALKGNKIHPFARVVAVADVYDALTSDRDYKQGIPDLPALIEMADTIEQFDFEVFQIMVRIVLKREKLVVQFNNKYLPVTT